MPRQSWLEKQIASALLLALAMSTGIGHAAAEDIVVGTGGIAVSMDPLFAIDTGSLDYSQNVYDSLITYDSDLNVQPSLAVSWTQVDEQTWEFKLREGVKFHDGQKLSASDVVASLKRATKEVPGSSSPITQFFSGVTDILAVSDDTVRVCFGQAQSAVSLQHALGGDHTCPSRGEGEQRRLQQR